MLKKVIFLVLILALFFTGFVFGTRIVDLDGPVDPGSFYIDNNRIYIVEKVTVYIYSLKDLKLITKFGKAGEGPKEFMMDKDSNVNIQLSFRPGRIIVSSKNKISFFSNDGKFIKEFRVKTGKWYKQFGENYVGLKGQNKDNLSYDVINLYDPELKKIKQLTIKKGWYQQNAKMSGVDLSAPSFVISGDHMVVTSSNDFSIFNIKGIKLLTVDYNFKRKRVTKEDERNYRNWMKKSPVVKQYYENLIKNKLVFPEYFPKIKYIGFTDKDIYITAYKKKEEKNTDVYFFNLKGKFLKKIKLPIVYKDVFYSYPFEIYNGKLYQLIEDDENENTKLHITKIKLKE